ncbi:MAG: hypothetical protein K8S23_02755 [Candidatus Cloacimonetes bacterium]|nr:hypothetical protein [Candidatus Cloacimonadota bacterium]
MKKKVLEILLVSTFYDAFIFEQDGRLSEQIFGEYMQLNLSTAPRITSVPTGKEALEKIQTNDYDLVITMMRIGELNPFDLSKKIKEMFPQIPILLLLNIKNDVSLIDKNSEEMQFIDNVFIWNGDSNIFLTMVKYIEDIWNVQNDTEVGLVRVILLVEDSIHYYSRFHPLLYGEIMKQTQRLISEELNDINKRQRMRARPKVILVHTYEDAIEMYEKYKEFIIAVFSDIRYECEGKIYQYAGLKLIEYLRLKNVKCPLLLQSADIENKKHAQDLGVHFLNKNSKTILQDIRKFILNNLGFGDFIFRNKSGLEIDRASSIAEFKEKLTDIPDESLIHHGKMHNFSAWLTAHGEFLFAKKIQGYTVDDFTSTEHLRDFLISLFKEVNYIRTRGKIIQFSSESINVKDGIIRLSDGSFGGKGRGLAFLNALFASMEFEKQIPEVNIKIPQTYIIGTNEYNKFIDSNRIEQWVTEKSDEEIRNIFRKGNLSPTLIKTLQHLIFNIKFPLAVRSSGLLEDSQSQPFAGIYETYMLPNNNINDKIRLSQLENSIKLVYASVYLQNTRNYIESINYELEAEKMAVLIQEVVGYDYNGYFYPNFSGVGQSYNFYPTSFLKNTDSIVSIAVGLGKMVVEGKKVLRFAPEYPKHDIVSQDELMGNSQKYFYAIDLKENNNSVENEDANIVKLKIKDGEKHGSLNQILSVWDFRNNRIVEALHITGPRLVTFTNILKYNSFPLAKIAKEILKIGEKAMGVPVEIEFAVNLEKDISQNKLPTFYVLQIRPLNIRTEESEINIDDLNKKELLLLTKHGMGNGTIDDVKNIIFLAPSKFDRIKTIEMQQEIAKLNQMMKEKNKKYILIAPGRWGSRDRFLGIPVKWHEISMANIIIEVGIKGFIVDASQGSHFFHNLVSMNAGYFTVPYNTQDDFIDWDWLQKQKMIYNGDFFSIAESSNPYFIKMDGKKGVSYILKT